MPYLSADDIYDRIFPPDFNLSGNAAEANRISDHFKKIPDIVADMAKTVRPQAQADYRDNLMRVAIRMVNNGAQNTLVAGAALKVAALAVHGGADSAWAEEKVFAPYHEMCGKLIGELAQSEIKNKGRDNASREDYHLIVGDLFTAAALVPPTIATAKIHTRAEECLGAIRDQSLDEYQRIIQSLAPLCRDQARFPGAITIVGNSYDLLTDQQRDYFAEQKKKRGHAAKGELIRNARYSLSLDAVFIVRFNDLPQLDQRATHAFCEHYKVIKDISPKEALETLDDLAKLYKNTPNPSESVKKGCEKLLVLVEYFQNAPYLTAPKDYPAHLFNDPPAPKTRPLEMLH